MTAADWARAVRCVDRILRLVPDNAEAMRDRGMGYLELGHSTAAVRDLGQYIQMTPEADDVENVRNRLLEQRLQRLH